MLRCQLYYSSHMSFLRILHCLLDHLLFLNYRGAIHPPCTDCNLLPGFRCVITTILIAPLCPYAGYTTSLLDNKSLFH